MQFGASKRPRWVFTSSKGKDTTVSLTASLNSHDGGFLIAAAERGLGIVRVPDFLAKASLESGRLVQILKSHELSPRGVYFVYPSTRHLPQRTRALLDFLLTHFASP